MHSLSRRQFTLGLFTATALAGVGGVTLSLRPSERVVIVGGGPAGAQAALSLRAANPAASVLLIERDPGRLAREAEAAAAFTRPRSEATLAALKAAGVEVALDDVTGIDWRAARLDLFSNRSLAFDRLLLAPGTAPRPEAIAGLDAVARHTWPAAWGNDREARRLAGQLAAMPERGHLVLRLPGGEISHPQVALARALDLSQHLATHRPAARFTVLDASATDHLAEAFATAAADRGLGRNVVWLTAAQGATVRSIDARQGLIETDAGQLRADVVNFVVPHAAGEIARSAGLVDGSGWCPCDALGRSALRPEALVLGDARKAAVRTVASARLSAQALATALPRA